MPGVFCVCSNTTYRRIKPITCAWFLTLKDNFYKMLHLGVSHPQLMQKVGLVGLSDCILQRNMDADEEETHRTLAS